MTKSVDNINSPTHYNVGGLEVIDIIDAFGLNFCLGNVVKYILRAGRKDNSTLKEDLQKAEWYLKRAISQL